MRLLLDAIESRPERCNRGPKITSMPTGREALHLAVAAEGTIEQDRAFGIQQILDIAARALSPGINTPGTAALCIDHMSAIFVALAAPRMPLVVRGDAGDACVTVRGRRSTRRRMPRLPAHPRRRRQSADAGAPRALRASHSRCDATAASDLDPETYRRNRERAACGMMRARPFCGAPRAERSSSWLLCFRRIFKRSRASLNQRLIGLLACISSPCCAFNRPLTG